MGIYVEMEGEIDMKIRKFLTFIIIFSFIFSCFSLPTYANTQNTSNQMRGITSLAELSKNPERAEELMTFDEMVSDIAKKNHITYSEALASLPDEVRENQLRRDIMYITRVVYLDVTSTYKPQLEFYCQVAAGGNFYNILSIYNVELVRSSTNPKMSKQFQGTIKVWLRSTQQIEYVINGDFYNNGTTSSSGGIGVNAGINQLISISFSASSTTTSNHYKYFYKHDYYNA